MTFDRDVAVYEALRKELRKFTPLPVRENRRRGEAALPSSATAGGSVGAYIHLTRGATQSIASAGEAISWDTAYSLIPPLGFATPTLPSTTVTVPTNGYYDIDLTLGWDTFVGGGTISIIRTRDGSDDTIWPPADDPGIWSATYGRTGSWVAPSIPLEAGDTIRVNVNPDDASAQTLVSATMATYLVDRGADTTSSTYAQTVLASQPLAYWRLDESAGPTAADSAGHALGPFDMTYQSTPEYAVTGVMNDGSGSTAVYFNETGADDHALGSDWADLEFNGTASYTLEAWVTANDPGAAAHRNIVQKKRIVNFSKWALLLEGDGAGNVVFQSTREDGTNTDQADSGSYAEAVAHYVVATFDGSTLRLYVDGVEDGTDTTINASLVASTSEVKIAYLDGPGISGIVDEVAIYDRALTPGEIVNHYNVGIRGV
jgi:hypothetical protein